MSLGRSILDAIALRKQLKAQGISNIEATFEAAIRAVWPFTREWKYLCESCGDIGLEIIKCPGTDGHGRAAICGRCKWHAAHDFGRSCLCGKGADWRPKEKAPSDFTEAGRTSKPRRFGR